MRSFLLLTVCWSAPLFAQDPVFDVVIYGGTSGGVAAAVQTARMGRTAIVIEPGKHLGGLTAGGLGATDIGNKRAIGGIAREFYRRIGEHYAKDDAWTFQSREVYLSNRRAPNEPEMWTFEPHVAETLFLKLLTEHNVPTVFEERLDLRNGVVSEGKRIKAIRMESGKLYHGRVFIDATYEGDLMAKAGVKYHVGREANATYQETLNGVQVQHARFHQFKVPVDPYVKPGDPASGLLPGIQKEDPGIDGQRDHRVQAYNFRMCLTDALENRLPFPKPRGYDPLRYELLLRYINAGVWDAFCSNLPMPNRKTDTNNCGAFSTDHIGANYAYPEGDYATRAKIFQDHVEYQQGLMYFLANDPRVPEKVRKEIGRWGLSKDEFPETGGWPHQMYVREARRLISEYVMTQHNCQGKVTADDSVGLAAYTMDSHNTQRYVKDGRVLNEGDVQVGGFPPYPIAYRSLRPREAECLNLLVPVCLSASHIAYGSIRMEPVFMVLGQSTATAAVHSLEQNVPVQRIDVAKLQARLKADGQVLEWEFSGRSPKSLPGVVVDDTQAEKTGAWTASSSITGYIGSAYLHDGNTDKGKSSVKFTAKLPKAGRYTLRVAYTANPNRATNVPITILTKDGEKSATLDQKKKSDDDGFATLGTFEFGTESTVTIGNADTDGYVIVDAVQWLP